jgi:2-iminobutanoate/2-iminopropanoate deaminase
LAARARVVTDMPARIDFVNSDELPRPGGHYTDAVRFGDLVFVSGQLATRPDGSHTANLPFEDQVRQALDNVLAALRSAGATKDDLVKVTAYIVDVARWPRFNAIYAEVMGNARPARTVVPVVELHYGYLVEIDAIAASSAGGQRQ